jgi:hypothetical protein
MYSAGKLASPQDFPTVIHRQGRLSTDRGVGVCLTGQERAPEHLEYGGGVYSVPA